jgi:hypothetical protein
VKGYNGRMNPKHMNRNLLITLGVLALALTVGCGEESTESKTQSTVPAPKYVDAPIFNEDSAFVYIEQQLAFGPRTPNSKAQEKCALWLQSELANRGANASIQEAKVLRADGVSLRMMNIIGAFRPEQKNRILLSAHWDSRHISDADPDQANTRKAVPAANDGGSGVAVLLEIARLFQKNPPPVGVDIIFWDVEDQGTATDNESWCLGSKYWAQKPHVPNYKAQFAINLDMVGGVNTWFPKEQTSIYFAREIVDEIWETANALGYGDYFPMMTQDAVMDDHVNINRIAGIPAVNIIARDLGGEGFYSHWHTVADDIEHISKPTLKAVGQTVTQVVYNRQEK